MTQAMQKMVTFLLQMAGVEIITPDFETMLDDPKYNEGWGAIEIVRDIEQRLQHERINMP